jgi:hypothetical protein
MGISPHGGSVRQPGVGSSTGDFKMWLKGVLVVECLSLWELCEGNLEGGLPCWGTWRIGRKGSGTGISFHRGPIWGTWRRACLPGTLRTGRRGLWGWGISLWRSSMEGTSGGAPLLGTREDMLGRFPDAGIYLHGGPFPFKGNLLCGGCSYTEDFDRWMKEGSGGASLCKGFHEGTLKEGSFTGEPERWGFWDMQNTLQAGLPLYRGPVGEPAGGSFAVTFEGKEKCIWVPFLDPEAITILSLGVIWNFGKGTGLSWVDIRLWGTKGPSIRPRCIGTIRARTQR